MKQRFRGSKRPCRRVDGGKRESARFASPGAARAPLPGVPGEFRGQEHAVCGQLGARFPEQRPPLAHERGAKQAVLSQDGLTTVHKKQGAESRTVVGVDCQSAARHDAS